jgi:hypothetical protein
MKQVILPLLGIMAVLLLASWGTPDGNYNGRSKNSINFYGTLQTWQGQTYKIENISFDHNRYLTLYDKPLEQTNQQEPPHHLEQNPTSNFVKTKLDIHEIASLEVINPENPWIYQKKRGSHETEYLEVMATSKDIHATKTTYLVESHKKLYCQRMITKEEREVPFAAIKELKIEGFRYCEPDHTNNCNIAEEHSMPTPSSHPIA